MSSDRDGMRMTDLPIACTLGPAAQKARKQGLLAELVARADERLELPEGYRLRFAPSEDTLVQIARMVEAERHCCRFLRFTITVEPDEGPMILDLTGPAGTGEFLSALFES